MAMSPTQSSSLELEDNNIIIKGHLEFFAGERKKEEYEDDESEEKPISFLSKQPFNFSVLGSIYLSGFRILTLTHVFNKVRVNKRRNRPNKTLFTVTLYLSYHKHVISISKN